MYSPELRTFLIAGIVFFFFNSLIFDACSEEIEAPLCPIVYGDGGGNFELYWFYTDNNILRVGNNTIVPERGVIPMMGDRQYSIFTTINLTPPYYIESSNTYIMNSDMYPDLPGDQFRPVRMAIKKKVADNYYEDIWYQYVGLDDADAIPGAIVEGSTNVGAADLFEIYLALEWLPGTPTAPQVGVNSLAPYFYQTLCPMDDSSYQTIYTTASAMVGAKVLCWHTDNIEIDQSKNNDLLNFEVLYSDDSAYIFSNGEIIAATGSDSMRANFNLPQSGYITVKAINGAGESYSDILFLDKNRLSPASVGPSSISLGGLNYPNDNQIMLENLGSNNLDISIIYDRSLLILSDSSLILETSASAEIMIEFLAGIDLSYQIKSPIIIKTAGEYYPQIIYVTSPEKSPTAVENNELLLPEEFSVSQPYPNPFNSSVRFSLTQTRNQAVQMDIYNIVGQKIFSQNLEPGYRRFIGWDGIDNIGGEICSGIYFIRFSTNEAAIIRKAVLLK